MKYTARLLTVTTFSLFFPSLLLAQEELPMENSDPSNTTNAVEQTQTTADDESFFSDESLQAKEDDTDTLEEDGETEVNASPNSNSTNISSQTPQSEEEEEPTPIIFNEDDFTQKVKLQALNKITARTISIEVTKGNSVKFGNLEITLHRCWRAPETEIPESKALLFIQDKVPGQEVRTVFEGWMFASSPSISTLEHPVYDVRVLECIANKKVDTSPKSTKPE